MKTHSPTLHNPIYLVYPRLQAPSVLPHCQTLAARLPLHLLPQYLLTQARRWWR